MGSIALKKQQVSPRLARLVAVPAETIDEARKLNATFDAIRRSTPNPLEFQALWSNALRGVEYCGVCNGELSPRGHCGTEACPRCDYTSLWEEAKATS